MSKFAILKLKINWLRGAFIQYKKVYADECNHEFEHDDDYDDELYSVTTANVNRKILQQCKNCQYEKKLMWLYWAFISPEASEEAYYTHAKSIIMSFDFLQQEIDEDPTRLLQRMYNFARKTVAEYESE